MQHLTMEDDILSRPDYQIDVSIHHLSIGDESMSHSYSQLGDSELRPDSRVSSSETFSGDDLPTSCQATRRAPLNDFFPSCNAETVGPYLKRWEETGERTRASHVLKANTIIVAGLNAIAPGYTGYLWEAVRKSGSLEKELGIGEQQENQKYLKALAELYRNASSWETRRQILSIMGALNKKKAARKHSD